MQQKTRNNALDAICGLETILMPLSRHPQIESFLLHASLPPANFSVKYLYYGTSFVLQFYFARKRILSYNDFMKKLELLPDKIFSVLCENIKDPHCIFIFPTDTVMNSWIDHLILNPDTSGVEALPFERFIAWDNFKGSYIQAKKEGYTAVPSILRKFFVSDIIARNAEKAEKDRLQVIINPKNEFAQNASSFEDWIAGNLKSLHFWKKRMDENSCEYGEPDSEDKDYLYIYEKYKDFLEQNQLFEPSWIEDNDISDKDTRFILFYPELLEDFSDFLHIFDNAENLTVYTLPENLPEPKVYAYSDSRKELRQTMLRIIKLVKDGLADWSEIALSIPDIDTY